VSASLAALGRSTAASVSAVLRSFQAQDLGPLRRLLKDVEGARRLISAARLVAHELCLPAASRAAWDDCVAAFRDGADSDMCELRIAQLRELCVRRGHGWAALERQVCDVLSDQPLAVLAAGAEEDEVSAQGQLKPAGLPLERRLELSAGLIEAAPQERETVVWLVFANADLRSGFMRCGPMQLFSHRLTLSNIRDGCPALNSPDFERPIEFRDPFAEPHLSRLPDEPFVLARIALPPGRIADVEQRARELASGLVDAANPDSHWILARGAAMFGNGGWWGTLGFADPAEVGAVQRRLDAPDDGTAEALRGLDDRLVRQLANNEEAAVTAIAELRWENTVGAAADPAQRIALLMRVLERALPVARGADETLRDSCERYLLDAWAFRAFSDELFDAAYYGIWSLPRDEPCASLQLELREAVLPFTGELSFAFRPHAFMKRVSELVSALPEGTMEHRMASQTAAAVATPGDALRHLGHLDASFRKLLARAMRQRNAVVHGAATVPAVVLSCEPLIRELSRYVVAQRMAAVSESEELLDRLEHARAAWLRQRQALELGQVPAEVLFAGTLRREGAER
jgi:hypothetical protein